MEETATHNLHQRFEQIIARKIKEKERASLAITQLEGKEQHISQDIEENSLGQYIIKDQESFYSALFKLYKENDLFLTELKAHTGIYRDALINALIDRFMHQEGDRRQILSKIVTSKESEKQDTDLVKVSFKVKQKYTSYLLTLKSKSRIKRDLIINKTIEHCRASEEFRREVLKIAYHYHQEAIKRRKKTQERKKHMKLLTQGDI